MMEQIQNRRSIRKYDNKPIEDEKIYKLLESARLAPSGNNLQPWHFIVVKSDDKRQQVAKTAHDQKWMMTAPVFIVCIGDIRPRIGNDRAISVDENSCEHELKQTIRDTSIAAEHIVLMAEELGLSTCWIGWYTQQEMRKVLNIPSDKYVVSILTVGYADEKPAARPRKKLEDIVHYEIW